MTYAEDLCANRYARAVLAIRGKFSAKQLHDAAAALARLELGREKPFGEQHLLQEAKRILKEIA